MKRLLIANRGEIAVRIARTAREMGIRTVAVHSEVDADALHVRVMDEAVAIGPAEPARSYLDIAAILRAARDTGSDAVHPGYGFLSENAGFAQAVLDAGLTWVGPPPAAMAALGDKLAGRRAALAAGVPVVPGTTTRDPAVIAALGFPLLVKASGGGGGRGMRVVSAEAELGAALASAEAEAASAFGDPTVYAERLLLRPRHVEVQILGDQHGHVYALGERECSIQRRHQKLVEESPCVALDDVQRRALHEAAVRLARAAGYTGAGTVEFLLDEGGAFYFLEVNARLQVEHPVTELCCGVDLVRDQLRVAMGEALDPPPAPRGHAIECRIIAENPAAGFVPSPGRLTRVRWPMGPGVRVDAGVGEGDTVSMHYDALLAKIIVFAPDRDAARRRMLRALEDTVLVGVGNTVEFLHDVLATATFTRGELSTDFLDRHFMDWQPPLVGAEVALAAWLAAPTRLEQAGAPVAALRSPWDTLGRT